MDLRTFDIRSIVFWVSKGRCNAKYLKIPSMITVLVGAVRGDTYNIKIWNKMSPGINRRISGMKIGR
jgi:hypothetical protein